MKQILIFPHEKLRLISSQVKTVDNHLTKLLKDMQKHLVGKNVGVGLAAPQLGINQRVFALYLPNKQKENQLTLQFFINPTIVNQSSQLTLGVDKKDDLEGCLSIPKIYAPVWRPEWLELSYQQIKDGQWQTYHQRFTGFAARVIAHEYDHLQGILFIDHVLSQGTTLYLENNQGKLEPITREDLFAIFGKF